jgi:hypothetical protein
VDSGDDRYSTASVGRDWTLIPGPGSALIDNERFGIRIVGPNETGDVDLELLDTAMNAALDLLVYK